jgi:DNA-binding response OmpR family regulator
MKILLVDDEEKFVSRLSERLKLRGFECDWATNCDAALLKAKAERYSMAVLDVKMPCMSGFDLKKRLEQLSPDMKFIFITGHGSEEDYSIGSEEGACYIVKPFKIETLIDKISSTLDS